MAKFQIKNASQKGGWRVYINGRRVSAKKVTLSHTRYGRVEWGLRPEGFTSWAFREPGGGGSVNLPFAISPSGEVFVALLREQRKNSGGKPHWWAIGGAKENDETHLETATRETIEEAGLVSKPLQLPGLPGNQSRLYWIANVDKDEGVHHYCVQVPWELLLEAEDEGYKIAPGTLNLKKEGEIRFFPWWKASVITPDELALSLILRLLVMLRKSG